MLVFNDCAIWILSEKMAGYWHLPASLVIKLNNPACFPARLTGLLTLQKRGNAE